MMRGPFSEMQYANLEKCSSEAERHQRDDGESYNAAVHHKSRLNLKESAFKLGICFSQLVSLSS